MNSTLRSIQHTIGNQPLKWPTLGSADKYTTLLPLVWPIKPVFHLEFFRKKRVFAKFSLVSDCFRSKKSGSNPTYCFRTKKSRFLWKKLQVENQFLDQVCQQELQVALDTPGNPAKQIRSLTWNTENRQDAISDF